MVDKKSSNYQDLLKTIAIIAMIIDHLGLYFFPEYQVFRAIGRVAMPIFCFFVGYNYSKPKHIITFLGAILTFILLICFDFVSLNMLIVMYIGQWLLYFTDKYDLNSKSAIWPSLLLLIALTPFTQDYLEYGSLAIALILVGRCFKKNAGSSWLIHAVTIASILFSLQPDHFMFTMQNQVIVIVLLLLEGYLLGNLNHAKPIKMNLKLISRNSLYIYFFDVLFSIIGLVIIQLSH